MKKVDDFVWENYTNEYYLKEAIEAIKRGEQLVINNDAYINNKNNNEIIYPKGLHINYRYLYNDIINKGAKSVFEVGCGGGHSLYNIKYLGSLINRDIEVAGIELTNNQVNIMSQFLNIPKDIVDNIIVGDASKSITNKTYDYIFTNAVLMHINHEKVVNILKNIMNLNPIYIRLSEDFSQHNYVDLFNESGINKLYDVIEDGKLKNINLPTLILKRK